MSDVLPVDPLITIRAETSLADPGAIAKAEAIVQAHIAAQPALMAIPPAERQAAHGGQLTRSSSE